MKRVVIALAAGVLFGAGLVVSGMTDPRNVIGFLDFGGAWNPRLMAVMAGAIGVHATLLRLAGRPLTPDRSAIDARLVGGAAIFGVGWGLAGYCPGPAVAMVGGQSTGAVLFVAAMVAGTLLAGVRRR